MAIVTWPTEVPYAPLSANLAPVQTYSAPVKSDTEGGPPIMRPRPGPRSTEMPWQSGWLKQGQWEAFEQFARYDLKQGTLPFIMPVWRPNGCYLERTCLIKDGSWTCDFSKAPLVRVSFTLIVWNW